MSQDRLVSRSDFIGGSDANVILSGCPERLMRLWREKRGEEPAQDLSGNLPVMLGCPNAGANASAAEADAPAQATEPG
jgi:hypothetical protein